MWSWLDKHSAAIQALGALAAAVSVVFSLIALSFTLCQLRETRRTDLATAVYTVQKDAREILSELQSDGKVRDYLFHYDENKKYPIEVVSAAEEKLPIVFQFYSSVFNQYRGGVLPQDDWNVFADEICTFAKQKPIAQYLAVRLDASKYNRDFKAFIRKCINGGDANKEKTE